MTKEEEIRELREMLNTAIRNLQVEADLQSDQNVLQAENIEAGKYFFNRCSFYLFRKPFGELVEDERRKYLVRKRRFYNGHPGVPRKIIDPGKTPGKGTKK